MKAIKYLFLILIPISCSSGTATEINMKDLPKTVLYGVDVKDVSHFKTEKTKNIVGLYQAEQGGAEVNLTISLVEQGYSLTRVFQEPGMPKEEKEYIIKDYSSGVMTGLNLYGIFVTNGLLLLEKDPKSFGIPDDMWIFYNKR